MNSESVSESSRDFASVAIELSMLTPDEARDLVAEASSRQMSQEQIVIQKGMLDAVEMDIVHTLMNPKTVVPGYEILKVIGKGGMGVVYQARQQNLDRLVALKTILVSKIGDQQLVARFEQEARTVGRMAHPNIVAAYDFGRHEGRVYLAMELVEGEDADQLIQRRRGQQRDFLQEEFLAWGIARQVAAGLAHATQHEVVHRDIKPANLLLVDPPEGFSLPTGIPMVKIADFGLAFLAAEADTRTRLTADNMTVGSPHYMAPEQLTGSVVDHRADIYALGATVYHIVAGSPPFRDDSIMQIVAHKLNEGPPLLREHRAAVSVETSELLAQMMACHAEDRIVDFDDLIRRIDQLMTGLSQSAADSVADRDFHQITLESPTGNTREISTVGSVAETRIEQIDTLKDDIRVQRKQQDKATSRSPSGFRSSRFVKIALASVVTLFVVAAFVKQLFFNNDPTQDSSPPVQMEKTGVIERLFDGQTTAGWRLPDNGQWDPAAKNDDGAFVLEGANGTLRRLLPLSQSFRLGIVVQFKDCDEVDIRFGEPVSENNQQPRFALRLTKQSASVRRSSADSGSTELIGKPKELATRSGTQNNRSHDIRIDRIVHMEQTFWAVEVDGEVIASTIVNDLGVADFELQLAFTVKGGAAWFSDMTVEGLKPVDD